MSQTLHVRDASYVLTLEEIHNLARDGGKPAETLMNVVALIAGRFKTDVCSVYLLEPDRANLVMAATLGLRPECVGTLHMALHEGLAGLVAEQVRPLAVDQAKKHPRFKYFREAGEDAYQSFLGVPLIDRGVLQGVLVVQTIEARVFREDEVRMLVEAAAQVAPVVSEARSLDRFIAPLQERLWSLARNLWWSWDHDSTGLFLDLDPVRWRELNHNPISLLAEIPMEAIERRAAEFVLHSRINYAYPPAARVSGGGSHLGRKARGCSAPSAGGVFLRGVRAARVHSDLLGRAGHLGGRSHQERLGSGYSAGGNRSVLRARVFPAATGSRRLAAGRVPSDRRESIGHGAGHRGQRRTGRRADRNAHRLHSSQSLAREGGPLRSAAARFQRGRQRSRRSRTYFAALRRRRPRANSPGVAAGRGRLPRIESDGDYARRPALERRTQRLCGARSHLQSHARGRADLRCRGARAFRARWCSPRIRRYPPATTGSMPI